MKNIKKRVKKSSKPKKQSLKKQDFKKEKQDLIEQIEILKDESNYILIIDWKFFYY